VVGDAHDAGRLQYRGLDFAWSQLANQDRLLEAGSVEGERQLAGPSIRMTVSGCRVRMGGRQGPTRCCPSYTMIPNRKAAGWDRMCRRTWASPKRMTTLSTTGCSRTVAMTFNSPPQFAPSARSISTARFPAHAPVVGPQISPRARQVALLMRGHLAFASPPHTKLGVGRHNRAEADQMRARHQRVQSLCPALSRSTPFATGGVQAQCGESDHQQCVG